MYKQPNVPPYSGGSIPEYLHTLWRFLKDFCLEVWKFCDNLEKRVKALEEGSE